MIHFHELFSLQTVAGKMCSYHHECQAGTGQSPHAPSGSLLSATERGDSIMNLCKHKGSSIGKPGLHSEHWKTRVGFMAVLSFAGQLQLSPQADFPITTEASQPCHIHTAISLTFRTTWSRPVNTKRCICIFEEQRYNSSRCFLTSSWYCCKNAVSP